MKNSPFLTKLKAQAEENPFAALTAGAAAITAGGKLLEMAASVRSKNAYAKQVKHSTKKNKKK